MISRQTIISFVTSATLISILFSIGIQVSIVSLALILKTKFLPTQPEEEKQIFWVISPPESEPTPPKKSEPIKQITPAVAEPKSAPIKQESPKFIQPAPVSPPTSATEPTRIESPPIEAPAKQVPVAVTPSLAPTETAQKAPSTAPAAAAKTGVSIPANYRGSNAQPVYPTWSQKNREQGTVVLRVLVKSDGTAGNVEIKSSSGYPRLDQSAIQAVKYWLFTPATRDGKPIDEVYELDITFKQPNN